MGKQMKVFPVSSLNKIDTTKYIEGSVFYTDRSIGILFNGKIKTLPFTTLKKSDVEKIVNEQLKKFDKHE